MSARGIRNNNPGNIEVFPHSVPWVGQVDVDKWGMAIFDTMAHGVRALARLLMLYQSEHQLCTVATIIPRFAPDNENDTAAYIADVCQRTGLAPTQWLNTKDPATLDHLVRAICWHENAPEMPGDADIAAGEQLALAS